MIAPDRLALLAERFAASGYVLDAVLDRLGPQANAALDRNTTLAASDALGAARDPQATLVRLLMLGRPVADADARAALGDSVDDLVTASLAEESAGEVRATVEIRPYGAGESTGTFPDAAWSGWVCHDRQPGMDGRIDAVRPDFVLGVSPASTTLAQMTIRRPVGRALDLGTGCGVQSLHLARHVDSIVATDVNPRALDLARITAGLNGLADRVDVRAGSLYEPVADEGFDLIVTNPPYVMSPPSDERLVYREGTFAGDHLVQQVIEGAGRHLNPGGTMQVLANWAITDQSVDERLASWVGRTGCDALVIERERLDPYEYVEMWLNDAGLAGSPAYPRRYREWLDYFASLGIRGVGMGWFSLHAAGRATPDFRYEEWPHSVFQPVGDAFAAYQDHLDASLAPDADLLARAWRVHPGVVQETMGRPGADDPEHIVLRQGYGLGRALAADTATAAFVGACDGDLTAGQIVGALAALLDVDSAALVADLVPRLRELVRDGYLS